MAILQLGGGRGELFNMLLKSPAGALTKVQLNPQACVLGHCPLYLAVVTVTSFCSSESVHKTCSLQSQGKA